MKEPYLTRWNYWIVLFAIALPFSATWFALRGGVRGRMPDLVWGRRGVMPGDVVRPRAAVIIADTLFVVDFTARIQSYDLDGRHTGVSFTTPDFRDGRPSGLGVDNEGNLLVCDSHYHCVRTHDVAGNLLRTIGNSAQLGYVSDCVQDETGHYYVAEFGVTDRITKLDSAGNVLKRWGETGNQAGQFQRVRSLAFGPDGNLYVADACNHRLQVFNLNGDWLRTIGGPGDAAGQFHYPYDLAFGPDKMLYVVERGNARVQKFTPDGTWVGSWGMPGRGVGQLADPWALAVDRFGRVHVIDTENHRVQRIAF